VFRYLEGSFSTEWRRLSHSAFYIEVLTFFLKNFQIAWLGRLALLVRYIYSRSAEAEIVSDNFAHVFTVFCGTNNLPTFD
jgi:hypothetical protein